ncbi:MAG: hypothetical protein J3K34DRAFT_519753 [Monoraphidium minutum]|nr:MAG: hypothetical protein J3K34DRAFT_519753 [Monoraphidium minutum]
MAASSLHIGSRAHRFKYDYRPADSGLGAGQSLGLPLSERDRNSRHVAELTDDAPLNPADLWPPAGAAGAGAASLPNPHAQRFRIKQVPLAVPVSFPGSDYWQVEILNDYSKEWPGLERLEDGTWHLRRGFLAPLADPKLVPFFFYRGLEQARGVRYSVSDRAFQALFAAAYTAFHAAIFSALWATQPALAAAVGLNWARGRLSLGKWALLLALAATGRAWMYWAFEACRLVDAGLARIAPPVRRFFWANFTLWVIYLALAPSHFYPIPFWPFAPGSLGPHEAFQ